MVQTYLKIVFLQLALVVILNSANAFQTKSDLYKSYGNGVTFSYKVYKVTIPSVPIKIPPPIVTSRSPPLVMIGDSPLTHRPRSNKPTLKKRRLSRKRFFPVQPQKVTCGPEIQSSIKDLYKNVSCKPRSTVVEIESENPTQKVFPKAVLIKRCSGVCSGHRSCISAKQENVTVHITVNDAQCTSVQIPQDTACKCDCKVKKECHKNQTFNEKSCKCGCRQKKRCPNSDFTWDEKTCSCKCVHEKDGYCTTGTVWEPSLCRCVKADKRYREALFRIRPYN